MKSIYVSLHSFPLIFFFTFFSIRCQSLLNKDYSVQEYTSNFKYIAQTYHLDKLNGFYPIHSNWILTQKWDEKISSIRIQEKSLEVLTHISHPTANISLLKINGTFDKEEIFKINQSKNISFNNFWVLSFTYQPILYFVDHTLYVYDKLKSPLAAFSKIINEQDGFLFLSQDTIQNFHEFAYFTYHQNTINSYKKQLKKIQKQLYKIQDPININNKISEQYEDLKIKENLLTHQIQNYPSFFINSFPPKQDLTLSIIPILKNDFSLPTIYTGIPEGSDSGAIFTLSSTNNFKYKLKLAGILDPNSKYCSYKNNISATATNLTDLKIFTWIQQIINQKDNLSCCIQ